MATTGGSLVDDCATRLIAQSVAVDNTTLFRGMKAKLPDVKSTTAVPEPPAFLHLMGYEGLRALRTHNDGAAPAIRRPRAQVIAKGHTPAAVWALAQAAHEALQLVNTTIGARFYLRLVPIQSDPFEMGLDVVGRLKVGFDVEGDSRPAV